MHVVREGRAGDSGSPHNHPSAKKGGKSNWHKMENGKGAGSLKQKEKPSGHKSLKADLDLKAPKRPLAQYSGKNKGVEKVVKRKTV